MRWLHEAGAEMEHAVEATRGDEVVEWNSMFMAKID